MSDPASLLPAAIIMPDSFNPEHLRELEHYAEIGRLSACLLHEISNPLTAALLYLEQADDHTSLHIRRARHNLQLLQRYVEAARQQVRHESVVGSFYVRPQLEQVRRVLTPIARKRGVSLHITPPAQYKLIGDPVKFQQIIANLILNAIDAYDDSSLTIADKSVSVMVSSTRQWLVVRVSDHGGGITAEQLPLLFEPFYTTKSRTGRGLGIGLAAVKRYVEEDFYGTVHLTSTKSRGTEFITRLRMTPRYP